ncbi:unnamed protein product [Boreogadus saida]
MSLLFPSGSSMTWESSGAAGLPPKLWRQTDSSGGGELGGSPAAQLREYNPVLHRSCRTAAKLPPPELPDCR